MLSRVCSAAVNGIEAFEVEVEVNCGYGDTFIALVGLPDAAVKESNDLCCDRDNTCKEREHDIRGNRAALLTISGESL